MAMKGHEWVPCSDVDVLYPDCISVGLPAAILNYSFGGCSHWGELGKGCMGSLYYFSQLGVKEKNTNRNNTNI